MATFKAPLKLSEYPRYFQELDGTLLAFTSPITMYKIENVGTNVGCQGISIDHYITRRMVLKHWPYMDREISEQRFKDKYDKLFKAYRDKMTIK